MKELILSILNKLFLFDLYHSFFNKNKLTVVMFHRVSDSKDYKNEWSINVENFSAFLDFIDKYYIVIKDPKQKLPKNSKPPLIITFDDGWYDNYEFVTPILQKKRFPWILFLATGSITEYCNYNRQDIASKYKISDDSDLFNGLQLSTKELDEMTDKGCILGSHSHNHLPMSALEKSDLINEICQSKFKLKNWNDENNIPFSYPYGLRTKETDILLLENFCNLYTSVPLLNKDFRNLKVFGRIHISEKELLTNNKFDILKAKRYLFLRGAA